MRPGRKVFIYNNIMNYTEGSPQLVVHVNTYHGTSNRWVYKSSLEIILYWHHIRPGRKVFIYNNIMNYTEGSPQLVVHVNTYHGTSNRMVYKSSLEVQRWFIASTEFTKADRKIIRKEHATQSETNLKPMSKERVNENRHGDQNMDLHQRRTM